jgi:triacylglycerol esterase/lipase EstA (alpha/beta hydrolase family)
MAYGYNANVVQSKAITNVKNEAEILLRYVENNRRLVEERSRPIIFVCHSLGGIVMKKVMTL